MRATQVIAPGKAIFVDTPKPVLQPGHALVRVKEVSLCGSDIHMIHYSHAHEYPYPPGTSAHEMVGVIEAIDAPGSGLKVGDLTLTLVRGNLAMADYYLAPVEHVLKLPNGGKSDSEYLQAQQLGTIFYAAQKLPNLTNKNVVIIGQGSAGLWWNFVLRRMGARRLVALDLQPHRLALSKHYGATHAIHNVGIDPVEAVRDCLNGELADVVVEAAGEPDSINLAIDLVKQWGFVLQFGVPRVHRLNFHMEEFFRKRLLWQACVGAMGDPGFLCTWMAMELIDQGIADAKTILTHRFPFEQVMEAYELQFTRDEGAVKIVVELSK